MKVLHHNRVAHTWTNPKAKEPGHMRWMTNYVGGKPGTINVNPEIAAYSDDVCLGMMWVPVGCRQYGFHAHTVSEIYVVVKGEVISWDGNGNAEHMVVGDCCIIPEKSYHAFGNAGTEPCEIIWLHDRQEILGSSIYTEEKLVPCPPVEVVRLQELAPDWNSYKAKEVGYMRWHASYIGDKKAMVDFNPGQSSKSDYIALGMMGLEPYNKIPKQKKSNAMIYTVTKGKVKVNGADGTDEILEPTDCVRIEAGEEYTIRNLTGQEALLVWMYETVADPKETVYLED